MVFVEIILALAFIFFLLSVLASGVNEIFSLLLNKRGRELHRSIELLLNQIDPRLVNDFYRHPLIKPLAETPKWDSIRGLGLHIINFFRRDKFTHQFPPSYIEDQLFAKAFTDILSLSNDLQINTHVQDLDLLKKLYITVDALEYNNYQTFSHLYPPHPFSLPQVEEVRNVLSKTDPHSFPDVKKQCLGKIQREIMDQSVLNFTPEELHQKIAERLLIKPGTVPSDFSELLFLHSQNPEQWYQHTEQWYHQYMDRVSGWYKKRSHTNIFWISFIIVIFFNLNSIEITKALFQSEQLRQSLNVQLDKISVGSQLPQEMSVQSLEAFQPFLAFDLNNITNLQNLPGWFITIMAMSLGAPFWFDVISRFTRLKATGPPPQAEGS